MTVVARTAVAARVAARVASAIPSRHTTPNQKTNYQDNSQGAFIPMHRNGGGIGAVSIIYI